MTEKYSPAQLELLREKSGLLRRIREIDFLIKGKESKEQTSAIAPHPWYSPLYFARWTYDKIYDERRTIMDEEEKKEEEATPTEPTAPVEPETPAE